MRGSYRNIEIPHICYQEVHKTIQRFVKEYMVPHICKQKVHKGIQRYLTSVNKRFIKKYRGTSHVHKGI